jgi:hypothetical protein
MPAIPTRTALFLVLLLCIGVPAFADVPAGRVSVYSTPSGAYACIDSGNCDFTPATFSVTGNSYHTVTVREKGYRTWTDTVYVTADQTSRVDAFLDLDPDATGIRVGIRPGGAVICLDNMDCRANVGAGNLSGTAFFRGVSPGYHTISVEAPVDYEDTTRLVQVELGKVTGVEIELPAFIAPAPSTPVPVADRATGSIRVYVDRTGSTICLDNVDCYVNVGGQPGPGTGTAVFSDVTANEVHILTVAADGYRPVSTGITVGKDQVATADVSLQPLGGSTPATPAAQTSVPTVPPTMPTARSPLSPVAVIGALALCCMILVFRQ